MPINHINAYMNPLSDISTPNHKLTGRDDEKLKKACTDLEALFINQIFKSMRQTVPKAGLLGGGSGEEIFQSLFDQELSRSLAQQKGMGLGQMIYRQMTRHDSLPPPNSKMSLSGIQVRGSSISGQEE